MASPFVYRHRMFPWLTVVETRDACTAADINRVLKEAASGRLNGILGFEERPLVTLTLLARPTARLSTQTTRRLWATAWSKC